PDTPIPSAAVFITAWIAPPTAAPKQTHVTPLLPVLAMAGAGQVGAAIAIFVKTKNKRLRNVIKGALPVGFLGIGEPLLYGVTLPLGKPFLTACLGAAVGGAIQAVMKTAALG
ncbi:PTS transporter subunit EIIC, partial [Bacillus sp. D-CC]